MIVVSSEDKRLMAQILYISDYTPDWAWSRMRTSMLVAADRKRRKEMALRIKCGFGHSYIQADIVIGELPVGAPTCPTCRAEWAIQRSLCELLGHKWVNHGSTSLDTKCHRCNIAFHSPSEKDRQK